MIRLAVRAPREQSEVVLAELLELAPGGVEEVDLGEAGVEYAVYGPPGELPSLPELGALAGGALVEISTSEVPDDWSERWKAFHRPVLLPAPASAARPLPALHVRPPWEPPHTGHDGPVSEIVVDPGQAFGTGAHATTRLCLQLLIELAADAPPGPLGPLVDVGSGSGVLAIAAARLGFTPILALDNEAESVDAAAANALVNGVELESRRFDLRSHELPWPPRAPHGERPVVLGNLLRPLLLELAARMPSAPAALIASGLLAHEADEVAAAFAGRLVMREVKRREDGEWAALLLLAG